MRDVPLACLALLAWQQGPLDRPSARLSPAAKAAALADQAAWQGNWTLVSARNNGLPAPPEAAQGSSNTVHADTTTMMIGGKLLLKATFTLDPLIRPKHVDFHILTGRFPAGTLQQGIYDIKGSTLQLCFAGPGKFRPVEFVTRPGDLRTCTVWRRARP